MNISWLVDGEKPGGADPPLKTTTEEEDTAIRVSSLHRKWRLRLMIHLFSLFQLHFLTFCFYWCLLSGKGKTFLQYFALFFINFWCSQFVCFLMSKFKILIKAGGWKLSWCAVPGWRDWQANMRRLDGFKSMWDTVFPTANIFRISMKLNKTKPDHQIPSWCTSVQQKLKLGPMRRPLNLPQSAPISCQPTVVKATGWKGVWCGATRQ